MKPVSINPRIMHGAPCFTGTRVEVRSLFDHLADNYSIDEFLAELPTVYREQVLQVLSESLQQVIEQAERVPA